VFYCLLSSVQMGGSMGVLQWKGREGKGSIQEPERARREVSKPMNGACF
jgi:hypothetical protein